MNQEELTEAIAQRADDPENQDFFSRLLLDLLALDNTPRSNLEEVRQAESACFNLLEKALRKIDPDVVLERQPIDPGIADEADFTQLYYSKSPQRPEGLTPEEAYKGRANLFAIFGGADKTSPGRPVIYSTHIDTVAPHIPPRREGNRIFGRGAVDDKGQVALFVTVLRILKQLADQGKVRFNHPRVYQFVIEEETGGNGSLSAARDPRFAGWDVVVGECAGSVPYPANRGAIWYQCQLETDHGTPDDNLLTQAAAAVVLALEDEGRKIKTESTHFLFEPWHVQTNHGILGPFGKHPSAVNDLVKLQLPRTDRAAVEKIITESLTEYCEIYGDKTQEKDEDGAIVLERHLELVESRDGLELGLFGKAGHMGALARCDGAITKAAFAIRRLAQAGIHAAVSDTDGKTLRLEGGQGFTASHHIEDISRRLADVAQCGLKDFLARSGHENTAVKMAFGFDELHNNTYASPVDCPAMQAFQRARGLMGRDPVEPRAWAVSCDARLFAARGHNVVVWGVGGLDQAHAADEAIHLDEIPRHLTELGLVTVLLSSTARLVAPNKFGGPMAPSALLIGGKPVGENEISIDS